MKKYFFLSFIFLLLFTGCSFFEPTYFIGQKRISQNIGSEKKKIDNIKWMKPSDRDAVGYKNSYKGFITYKKYDMVSKLWKYVFEPIEKGENIEFYYDKKLGYDGDLIEIFLENRNGINFLKDVVLIVENYQQSRYIKTLSSDELSRKKRLKKRTIDRVNWEIGLPKEEKIDIK